MLTLARAVDGVLLDPDRDGEGTWTNELNLRFGIEPAQLHEAFFQRAWADVICRRQTTFQRRRAHHGRCGAQRLQRRTTRTPAVRSAPDACSRR